MTTTDPAPPADSFRRPVWPEQFYGGEHFRPDGRLCSYLSHIWCERCNAAAPTVPAVVQAREAQAPAGDTVAVSREDIRAVVRLARMSRHLSEDPATDRLAAAAGEGAAS